MPDTVQDNAAAGRFELLVGGDRAWADYRRQDGTVSIFHVEAAPRLRGTGAADRLMRGMMEQLRADGTRRVVPYCGYAAAWIRRHREYADLVGG